MTKQELVDRVHANAGHGLTRKLTGEVVDQIFKSIAQSIQDDGKFYLPGFGTFQVKERASRTGRNPRTGNEIEIPASKSVTFKAAQALKESL